MLNQLLFSPPPKIKRKPDSSKHRLYHPLLLQLYLDGTSTVVRHSIFQKSRLVVFICNLFCPLQFHGFMILPLALLGFLANCCIVHFDTVPSLSLTIYRPPLFIYFLLKKIILRRERHKKEEQIQFYIHFFYFMIIPKIQLIKQRNKHYCITKNKYYCMKFSQLFM